MIIVTGGAGFIGSAFVSELNRQGVEDILVVDEENHPTNKQNLAKLRFKKFLDKKDFIEQIRKETLSTAALAIIHMGACSSTTEKNAAYLRENNFEYTKTLCEYSLKHSVRFIYASSAATYGDGSLGYSDEDSTTPAYHPLNLYGDSKQQFDVWALNNNLTSQIVGIKFFNVYGPNEYHKGDMKSMVNKAHHQVKSSGEVKLFKSYKPDFKDGEQKRDFIYIKDCLKVMSWFLAHPEVNGIFNLGSGKARSWNDLACAVFAALQKPAKINYIPMPDDLKNQYQYFTEAKMEKLRRAGCSVEFHSLEAGVADYVQNYLENKDPYL